MCDLSHLTCKIFFSFPTDKRKKKKKEEGIFQMVGIILAEELLTK